MPKEIYFPVDNEEICEYGDCMQKATISFYNDGSSLCWIHEQLEFDDRFGKCLEEEKSPERGVVVYKQDYSDYIEEIASPVLCFWLRENDLSTFPKELEDLIKNWTWRILDPKINRWKRQLSSYLNFGFGNLEYIMNSRYEKVVMFKRLRLYMVKRNVNAFTWPDMKHSWIKVYKAWEHKQKIKGGRNPSLYWIPRKKPNFNLMVFYDE